MFTNLKRVLIAVMSVAMFLSPTMMPASAATGPWSWNDISDKIADRQNRPIWASVYASPYWYLTDGQDLWNGGHVWKTDGNYLTDITVEVRNAGISRVDDILSDGQTILFLKNIVARNNNFEVLAFNGNYDNKTSYLRQYFGSDEGLASITGKDNKWMIVSTKGRVLLWNRNAISMSTYISNISSYQSDLLYSVRHASPADGYLYLPVAAVPISGGWFVALRDQNTVRFWRYDSNGSATEVTSQFSTITYLHALTSNGTTAVFAGGENSTTYANRIYTYNGVNAVNLSGTAGSLPFSSWNRVQMSWNGASWMILSNKDLVRFDGSSFQSYGKTRDYFVTISANPTKTFMLGGAESTDGITDSPSYPLMAKLTKVTEDGGISENNNNNSNNNQNQTTVNGISYWSWFEPNQTYIRRDKTATYYVGTWSQNGIKQIQIWINGQNRRTCDLGKAYGNQTCSHTLYGFDYSLNTTVSMNAKITDGNDQVIWTDLKNLTVSDTDNGNQTTTGDVSIWNWLEPSNSTLARGNSAVFKVQANATQGLNRIEVLVNGTTKRYCDLVRAYGTQTCDLTIYGNDYSSGSQLALNAKAMDYNGKTVWSEMRYLNIQDSGSSSSYNTPVVTQPIGDIVPTMYDNAFFISWTGNTEQYRVEIECQTCDSSMEWKRIYYNTTSNYSRSIQVSNLRLNTPYRIRVKGMNNNGYETAWSDYAYFRTMSSSQGSGSGNSNTNNSQTVTWVWSTPETYELKSNANATFNVGAWDGDGLQKIEMTVNGSVWNTCNFGSASGNRECSVNLNGNTFPVGSDIFVNAKVIDVNGNSAWTASRTYHVVAVSGSTGTTNTPTQVWTWSNPETNTLNSHESAVWNVGAWDAEALQRMEIWINGQIKNTCQLGNAYGNRECSYTIRANDYQAGSSVFVNASILDSQGHQTWSNSKTYAIQSSVQTGGQNFPIDLPGNIQVSSNADNGYTNNQFVTFTTTANDQDGIDRIDIMVNASLVKSCYNQSTCSYTGGPYNDRNTVSYGAKIVDKKGFALWTGYHTINKK